jgi:hypothetical protein
MAEEGNAWMTPKEISGVLGNRRSKEVFEDLIYNRKSRREILDVVIESAGCNEYSAEDFLREIVKPKES